MIDERPAPDLAPFGASSGSFRINAQRDSAETSLDPRAVPPLPGCYCIICAAHRLAGAAELLAAAERNPAIRNTDRAKAMACCRAPAIAELIREARR